MCYLIDESNRLRLDINTRRDLLNKLVHQSHTVEIDIQRAEKVNQKLQTQIEEYKVPQVMEYVVLKVRALLIDNVGARMWIIQMLAQLATQGRYRNQWNTKSPTDVAYNVIE